MTKETTETSNSLKGSQQGSSSKDYNTRWAADRTYWAADRTFIAWLRTSISMIGFGISLGKASGILERNKLFFDSYYGLKIMGLIFIFLAVLGLVGALIQNIRITRRLSDQGFDRVEPTPLGQVMGILVLVFGIVGGIFIFL